MAQSYDRNNSSFSTSANPTIVGFFPNTRDAYQAISELKQAGFNSDQIGIALRGDSGYDASASGGSTNISQSSSDYQGGDNRSFWQEVKDFFSGSDEHDSGEFRSSLSGMDLDDDRVNYYQSGIQNGGALVSVRA